jgi:hypothetical protein
MGLIGENNISDKQYLSEKSLPVTFRHSTYSEKTFRHSTYSEKTKKLYIHSKYTTLQQETHKKNLLDARISSSISTNTRIKKNPD